MKIELINTNASGGDDVVDGVHTKTKKKVSMMLQPASSTCLQWDAQPQVLHHIALCAVQVNLQLMFSIFCDDAVKLKHTCHSGA